MQPEGAKKMARPKVLEEEFIEGTGAELAEELRRPERADRRFRVVPLHESATEEVPSGVAPNAKALAALRQIADNQKDRPYSDGTDTQRLISEARTEESKPSKQEASEQHTASPRKLSGMGKFAGIIPSSE